MWYYCLEIRTGGTYNSTHESGVQQYHDLSHFNPVIIWQNLPMAFGTVSKNSNNFLPVQHNLLDIDCTHPPNAWYRSTILVPSLFWVQ